jgi:hypothetical protein
MQDADSERTQKTVKLAGCNPALHLALLVHGEQHHVKDERRVRRNRSAGG